jgi:Ca2+-binding RTX toxin-like protein
MGYSNATMKFAFGHGANSTQWYLEGTDISLLPDPPAGSPPPVASSIDETKSVSGKSFNNLLVFDDEAIINTKCGITTVDITGHWNELKNAQLISSGDQVVLFNGFVHVDVNLGATNDWDCFGSVVCIIGAKRGNVVTGNDADIISIEMVSNGQPWTNEFRINSGGGNDLIVLKGLDLAAQQAKNDYYDVPDPAGPFDTSGQNSRAFIAAGSGNDIVCSYDSTDRLYGEAGNDFLYAAGGNDTIIGGSGTDCEWGGDGADVFGFFKGSQKDYIKDFSQAQGDQVQISGFAGVDDFGDLTIVNNTINLGGGNVLYFVGPTIAFDASDFLFA